MKNNDKNNVGDLRQYIKEYSDDLELLRQNNLLKESRFITFAKDHGIPVSGVIQGDPSKFHHRGWLAHDQLGADGELLFHPFRAYTLHKILNACRLMIADSASLDREKLPGLVERVTREFMPSLERIGSASTKWNRIVDLAILLEPLYWPTVTGREWRRRNFVSEEEYESRYGGYREKIIDLVRRENPEEWQELHKELRIDAANMDNNGALYLLLRASNWRSRESLRGSISGALWIRHIAEILRRAFEYTHEVSWLEEDQAFGVWRPGGRIVAYGMDRPLDDILESRPRFSFQFGLLTGSVVRWYVEGDTEYHAILSILSDPHKHGIELINLKGNLAIERDNIALKLKDGLEKDRELRRFSIISFDQDVRENIKAIRRQVEQDNIVGYIAAHNPDFEFDNFTLDELVEIAAGIDDINGYSGSIVRGADWADVTCSREFEKRYMDVSARRPRGLKGEVWGRALAEYAADHQYHPDKQTERPLWREIRAALQARMAHYDLQRQNFRFDPDTFQRVDRRN